MCLRFWDYLHLSQFSLDISESQGKKNRSQHCETTFQIAPQSVSSADGSSAENLKLSTDFAEAQKTSW